MDLALTSRATILPPPTFVARRKAALRAVVAQLSASDLKPTSFEPFTVAPERRLWSSLHNPQLRSTCVSEIDDVEFRTFFGRGNAGPVRQAKIVGHVLDNAQAFIVAARSGRLDEPLRTARRLAEYLAEEAASRSAAMRVTAIGLYPSQITAAVLLSLDIEILGDDLRLGIENVTGSDSEMDQFHAKVEQKITRGALLSRRHAELAACGATCWIDDTALRITKAAGLTITDVVDLLAYQSELKLRYETEGSQPLACSIYWRAGVLHGRVSGPANRWDCWPGLLTVRSLALPATLISAMQGRRLGELIEHPLIPAAAVMTGWHDWSGWTSIPLRMATALVIDGEVVRRADGSIDWKIEDERVSR